MLLSAQSSFINGTALLVSGGLAKKLAIAGRALDQAVTPAAFMAAVRPSAKGQS